MLLGHPAAHTDVSRFVPGDTCACGADRKQMIDDLRTARIARDRHVASSVAQFSSRLTLCRTIAEYTQVLTDFYDYLYGAKMLYFCLDTAWNSVSYVGEEFLCCSIDGTSPNKPPVKLSSKDVFPAFAEDVDPPVICYFSPICFQSRQFGYTALVYDHPTGYDFSFRDWNKAVADTLEFLRMKNDIHYLVQCQQASALHDSLTGFYNLAEFQRQLSACEQQGLLHAVRLSFTPNGEYIYGEGFRADMISLVAKAIKQACINHELFCRTEKDVFLIFDKGGSRLLSTKLLAYINHALSGEHDERKVIISMAAVDYQTCHHSVEEVLQKATEQSAHDYLMLTERQAHPHYNALIEIRSAVYAKPQNAPTLENVSKKLCFSEGYFRTVYKRCFGLSYNQECIQAKLIKACYLLSATAMSVFAVASTCGYGDEKFFTRQFRQNIGDSPLEYRKRCCRVY